jgi:hypothetical protein
MSKKIIIPLFGLLIIAGVAAFVFDASSGSSVRERPSPSRSPSTTASVHTTSSTNGSPASSSDTPAKASCSRVSDSQKWILFQSEKYGFSFCHPNLRKTRVSTTNLVSLDEEPIFYLNLMQGRIIGPSDFRGSAMTAPITIAVHRKPKISTVEWLSGVSDVNLAAAQTGDLSEALARVESGESDFVLFTHKEGQSGTRVYSVSDVGGKFRHAALFVSPASPFIYEMSFALEGYGYGSAASPTDREYVERFQKIMSTFEITHGQQ